MLGRLGDPWYDPTLDPEYVSGGDSSQLPTYGQPLFQGNSGGAWAGGSPADMLAQLIKAGNGFFTTDANDPFVKFAQSRWWQFSVALSTDGRRAQISENNYLLYGGIGAAALLLITFLGSR